LRVFSFEGHSNNLGIAKTEGENSSPGQNIPDLTEEFLSVKSVDLESIRVREIDDYGVVSEGGGLDVVPSIIIDHVEPWRLPDET